MCFPTQSTLRLWALSLLLLCQPSGVSAAIYACTTPDGTTVFQDRPCPRHVPVESSAMRAARAPLGIHESWFVKPAHAEGRAFCDRRGCECGPLERSHSGSLAMAIADALYMDASWHHYDLSETAWQKTPTNSSKRYDRRAAMKEASCNIMMSQQVLKQFGEQIAATLKKQVQRAEELGYDIAEPCDRGDAIACEFYDAVELYSRLNRDAKALRISRDVLHNTSEP